MDFGGGTSSLTAHLRKVPVWSHFHKSKNTTRPEQWMLTINQWICKILTGSFLKISFCIVNGQIKTCRTLEEIAFRGPINLEFSESSTHFCAKDESDGLLVVHVCCLRLRWLIIQATGFEMKILNRMEIKIYLSTSRINIHDFLPVAHPVFISDNTQSCCQSLCTPKSSKL